jgi:hypothetical protein
LKKGREDESIDRRISEKAEKLGRAEKRPEGRE